MYLLTTSKQRNYSENEKQKRFSQKRKRRKYVKKHKNNLIFRNRTLCRLSPFGVRAQKALRKGKKEERANKQYRYKYQPEKYIAVGI